MPAFICTACGSQFAPSEAPPERCPVCEDGRQYVPASGQGWTTLEAMRLRHTNGFRRHAPDLYGIGTFPDFAIAQRALLVRTPAGNLLWDCVALLDEATVDLVRAVGTSEWSSAR